MLLWNRIGPGIPSATASRMQAQIDRAKRYRDRAAECLQLAELAREAGVKEQYETVAKHYLMLAEVEENQAGQRNRVLRRDSGTA